MASEVEKAKTFQVADFYKRKLSRWINPPQWAISGGEVSITSLKSITSANTPKSPQKLPPPTIHSPPLTTKPPPPPHKSQQ